MWLIVIIMLSLEKQFYRRVWNFQGESEVNSSSLVIVSEFLICFSYLKLEKKLYPKFSGLTQKWCLISHHSLGCLSAGDWFSSSLGCCQGSLWCGLVCLTEGPSWNYGIQNGFTHMSLTSSRVAESL